MRTTASHVAGILSPDGGFRVVVTERRADFEHHRVQGERILIVPNLMVSEPIPWNLIPWVVSQTEKHLHDWIRRQNASDQAINNYLARLMNP